MALQYHYNSSKTLQGLPREMLGKILVHTVEAERLDVKIQWKDICAERRWRKSIAWMRLRLVCKLWDDMIVGQGSVWNEIVAVHPRFTRLFLERANRPEVILGHHREEFEEILLDIIYEFSPKIVSLKMTLPVKVWEQEMSWLGEDPFLDFRRLEQLHISTDCLKGVVAATATLPFEAPKLKELRTSRFHLSTVRHLLSPTLERMEIFGDSAVKTSLDDICTALADSPNLRALAIGVDVVDDHDDHKRRKVALKHLEETCLVIKTEADAERFASLDCTALASADLTVSTDDLKNLISIISIIGPQVVSIAERNDYTRCRLANYRDDADRGTVLALGREEEGEHWGPSIYLGFDTYHEGWGSAGETKVFDAIMKHLGAALENVEHLDVEDVPTYGNKQSNPELVGPFPAHSLYAHNANVLPVGPMVFSYLRTLKVDHVRFRRAFLGKDPHDFSDLMRSLSGQYPRQRD